MKDSAVSIHSLVGYKTKFWGNIEANGFLRVDGFFSGKIVSNDKVFIGKHGIVKNSIVIANHIIVGGKVEGNIYAYERVEILKSAQVYGNIYSSSINIEDNISFKGICNILPKNEIEDILHDLKNLDREPKQKLSLQL